MMPPRVGERCGAWGVVQAVVPLIPGVVVVETEGHGGWWLSLDRARQVSPSRRAWAKRWSGSDRLFEEDCCWAAAAMALDEELATAADSTVREWWNTKGRASAQLVLDRYFPSTEEARNE